MSKSLKVLRLEESLRYNVASSTVAYLGKAVPLAATSAAVWKIARITTTVGGDVTIEFAATAQYDQIWDNRAALSYS